MSRIVREYESELVSITQLTSAHNSNMAPNVQSKHWCFTLNNYTDADQDRLRRLGEAESTSYLVFGREVGESGTPHLQGFISFSNRVRFNPVRALIGGGAHLETARGTPEEAAAYCKKDDDFSEFGVLPPSQGKRSDIERFKEWVVGFDGRPSERAIACEFPALFLRYRRNLLDLVEHLQPFPVIEAGEAREWQASLEAELAGVADDRKILWVVDPSGGAGKTWFVRKYLTDNPEKAQSLGVGKRDDLAHAIDPLKSVFFVNVPRGSMEFLQYSVLEMIKDRLVFSPKYNSMMKVLSTTAHVVVMCNEHPDETRMSRDRFKYIKL